METINIQIDLADSKYKYYQNNKDFYGTPEYYKAYWNWRKSKSGEYEPLESLVTGAAESVFHAIGAVRAIDRAMRKTIDNAVKDAVIKSGGTYKD
jgi:hypothetical protein